LTAAGGLRRRIYTCRLADYLTDAGYDIYERGMPRRRIAPEKKARIVALLWKVRYASLVARQIGVSYSTVWRLADGAGVELTAGREAKGYWRLAPARRAAVIEARGNHPKGTQKEIARAAGVSRSTVSRIEHGDCRSSRCEL
jgi:DNA invertase Pin-like site-specific DNA recombinase